MKKILAIWIVFLLTMAGVTVTTTTALASPCTVGIGQNCGAYSYSSIPMSNGFNTYVANQAVNVQSGTTQTITATNPGNWSMVSNSVPYGYGGVQTFPDVQQLTNDWCGTGWGGCQNPTDTPLSALSALKVTYSESTPRSANTVAEWAPDVWNDNYGRDVMFWADTQGRCNTGSYGGTVLGTATLDAQTWTVNRYGGAGAEIIFVLDSNPAVPDSCAQQTSGTIDIMAGFQWLVSHGFMSSIGSLSQLNAGWEVCSADNQTFTMSSYSVSAPVGGQGQQAPVVTTNSATSVTTSAATLNGSVNPEGAATTYQFDYGTTTSYGSHVPSPAASAGSGTTVVNESASIAGLAASTTYHYRIEASNSAGTTFGSDQQFTTSGVTSTLLVGDNAIEGMPDSNAQGQAEAFQYTASASGTSATVHFYVDSPSSATAGSLGIYTDSGGKPGTLLKQVSFTPSAGWNTVALSGVSITSGTRYWLAELGTTGILAFRDQGSGGTSYTSSQTSLTVLPAAYSSGQAWASGKASFYVSS